MNASEQGSLSLKLGPFDDLHLLILLFDLPYLLLAFLYFFLEHLNLFVFLLVSIDDFLSVLLVNFVLLLEQHILFVDLLKQFLLFLVVRKQFVYFIGLQLTEILIRPPLLHCRPQSRLIYLQLFYLFDQC